MNTDCTDSNANNIKTKLDDFTLKLFPNLEFLAEVTSTNDYLLHCSQQNQGNALCFAEKQTHGRGRRGQKWLSNPKDICFSLLWNTQTSLDQLAGLSLAIATMVAQAIESCCPNTDIQVKWPNDIFHNNKKIGGILLESTQHNDTSAIVIGIGLNIANDKQKQKLKNAYTCLESTTLEQFDVNAISASIVNSIARGLCLFEHEGLSAFTAAWEKFDNQINQKIVVTVNQKKLEGVNQGINQRGELLLHLDNNQTMALHSGKIEPPQRH